MRYLVLVGKKRDIRQNGIRNRRVCGDPGLPSFDNLWRGGARDAGDPVDHAHRGFGSLGWRSKSLP
jgi:hypothetical protein